MDSRRGDTPNRNDVVVTFVVPAYNEAQYLSRTLESINALDTTVPFETVVVDGGSDDETPAIAHDHGATVIEQPGTGVGNARNYGAQRATGRWVAFVDADTTVRSTYLDEMLACVQDHRLVGVTSRCRLTGPRRAKVPEFIMNHVFPRMGRPVLPGFNTFVEREGFLAAGGFPDVPNEDKAFSRTLASVGKLGVHDETLVETSGRRIADQGLAGVLWYYFKRDLRALRSDEAGDEQLNRVTLTSTTLAVLAGAFQWYHALVLNHLTAAFAGVGFFGGIALFMMDLTRPRVAVAGLAFLAVQLSVWVFQGMRHGLFGVASSALQVLLAVALVYGIARTRSLTATAATG